MNTNKNQDSKYSKKVIVNNGEVLGFININKDFFGGQELSVDDVLNLINNCDIQDQTKQAIAQHTDLLKAASE